MLINPFHSQALTSSSRECLCSLYPACQSTSFPMPLISCKMWLRLVPMVPLTQDEGVQGHVSWSFCTVWISLVNSQVEKLPLLMQAGSCSVCKTCLGTGKGGDLVRFSQPGWDGMERHLFSTNHMPDTGLSTCNQIKSGTFPCSQEASFDCL